MGGKLRFIPPYDVLFGNFSLRTYFLRVTILHLPPGKAIFRPLPRWLLSWTYGIFVRIQVEYLIQYIDILKSYLNLIKHMAKSVFYGASFSKYLGFNALQPSTRDYSKHFAKWVIVNKWFHSVYKVNT